MNLQCCNSSQLKYDTCWNRLNWIRGICGCLLSLISINPGIVWQGPARLESHLRITSNTNRGRTPGKMVEYLIVLACFAGMIAGQLWSSNSFSLFTRYFWLDEFYTHALVTDPDLGHSMRA